MTESVKNTKDGGIRVALVGYGLAGSVFHAPLIATTAGLSLTGIVTARADRQAAASTKYPEARIMDSVDEIWKNCESFDLVVVASPNKTHAALGLAAMRCGLHVVLDKPMAVSVAECEELISVAKVSNRILTVFQNRRWDSDFLTVQNLISDGRLGEIIRFESRFERWRPEIRPGHWREAGSLEDGSGLLFDLGSHLIDQALTIFGAPKFVYCEADIRRAASQADDDTFISIEFESGVRAQIFLTVFAKIPAPRFLIRGRTGSFEKFGLDPQEEALRAGFTPAQPDWGVEPEDCWGTLSTEFGGAARNESIASVPGNYRAFYEAVRDAITQDSPAPVDPADALLTMTVIESARQSAERHEVVLLEPLVLGRWRKSRNRTGYP